MLKFDPKRGRRMFASDDLSSPRVTPFPLQPTGLRVASGTAEHACSISSNLDMPTGMMTPLAKQSVLLAVSTILTVALLEFGSRMLGQLDYRWTPRDLRGIWPETLIGIELHRPSSLPGLDYELVPNRQTTWLDTEVRTNSAGMRSHEIAREKPPGVRRIAILGDSFTFGWRVPVEASYPQVLEGMISEAAGESAPRVEVLNLGVVGYSTRDEAIVMQHRAMDWSPDVVVVGYTLNDPEIEPVWLHNYFAKPEAWQYSNLLRRLAFVLHNRDIDRIGEGDYFRYLHRHPEKWASVVKGFHAMASVADAAEIELVLMIFPMAKTQSWNDYSLGDEHRQVAEAANEVGMDVIDLLAPFSKYDVAATRVMPEDPHPNKRGHRIAATALYRHLKQQYASRLFER